MKESNFLLLTLMCTYHIDSSNYAPRTDPCSLSKVDERLDMECFELVSTQYLPLVIPKDSKESFPGAKRTLIGYTLDMV